MSSSQSVGASLVGFASEAAGSILSVLDVAGCGLPLSVDLGLEYAVDLKVSDAGGRSKISLFPSKEYWAGSRHGGPDSGYTGFLQDRGWPDALVETYPLFGTAQGACISG